LTDDAVGTGTFDAVAALAGAVGDAGLDVLADEGILDPDGGAGSGAGPDFWCLLKGWAKEDFKGDPRTLAMLARFDMFLAGGRGDALATVLVFEGCPWAGEAVLLMNEGLAAILAGRGEGRAGERVGRGGEILEGVGMEVVAVKAEDGTVLATEGGFGALGDVCSPVRVVG